MASGSLFPSIGKVVDQTDLANVADDEQAGLTVDDDRPVQEIESLCMNCGEQVRHCHIARLN
jgi:zinc finger protein